MTDRDLGFPDLPVQGVGGLTPACTRPWTARSPLVLLLAIIRAARCSMARKRQVGQGVPTMSRTAGKWEAWGPGLGW